uniref:Uncharacterized protein n=1 Tax=Fagus sylvatica TaxID=28930 RepID=A0A2N9HA06_FAGSY
MRGGRVGFIENRARLAQHHHARRMTVLRELWYCHVAVLSFHASSPSNPPRFPCAYPFLSDFRGQFWRSSGTQNGSCGISSESSRRPLSNDIKFARIGVRTRELWLPEVGVSELFLCTLFRCEDSGQTGDAIGEPRVPRRSRSHYLSNAPGLADQLVASRKDSAREGGSCAAYFCKVPDSRESELGLVRYGPASRVHRGVFGPFEGSFPIRIPADPDKFLAIREFHVVHGCVLFPMCPGSQINLLRVRKTLCASVATSALHRGELGFARYDPANGGRRNVPYAKGGGQFDPVFGLVNGPVKPWSNLVNLGQTWSDLVKALQTLGNVPRTSFQGFLGKADPSRAGNSSVKPRSNFEPSSDQTGLVRAVSFCAPTLEKIPGVVPSFYTSQSKKHPWAACWDNKTRLGRREQAIYYLSKKFTEPETRYLLVEKTCCALAWASRKLRQYMLYYTTCSTSYLWPRKAIKGQAIADYLADYPSDQLELMDSEFPDEDVMTVDEDNHGRWKLYFDGAANAVGSGIGAVLVSPKGQQTPIAVKLGFDCTNNMTEYEACIVGLQAALEFGAYELEVFGDSLLIVSQTNGEWQARDPKLIPYQRYISRLLPKFKYITFTYTPRAHNHFADALATLASLIKLVEGDDVRPLRIETRDIPAYCVCVEECMNVEAEIDDKPWYYDIKRFIQDREYPPRATENEKKYIRRMAFQFFLSGEILYKRTHDATLLRCVDAEEANRLIQEMHAGLMGAHANGPFLARKIMRAGYYWLTMERDCIRHVQTCHKCQMYQNSKNAPPQYLHTMASPWPFSAWGMDVIGAITPKASNGHEFILVAIDYFTKWVEACSFKNVTQVAVTRFVKNNIICRYGMPEMLITDNASNLNNRMMDQLCQQFKIQHHNSAPIPSKDERSRRSCQQKLRTSVGATPYSLVYGMEAVLPVEVEIPSLRILSQTQLEEAEWAQARYEQLNFVDEKRLAALCHGQLYQRRIERAYNKKARPRTFQPGDLVLKKRNMALSDPRGKVRTII